MPNLESEKAPVNKISFFDQVQALNLSKRTRKIFADLYNQQLEIEKNNQYGVFTDAEIQEYENLKLQEDLSFKHAGAEKLFNSIAPKMHATLDSLKLITLMEQKYSYGAFMALPESEKTRYRKALSELRKHCRPGTEEYKYISKQLKLLSDDQLQLDYFNFELSQDVTDKKEGVHIKYFEMKYEEYKRNKEKLEEYKKRLKEYEETRTKNNASDAAINGQKEQQLEKKIEALNKRNKDIEEQFQFSKSIFCNKNLTIDEVGKYFNDQRNAAQIKDIEDEIKDRESKTIALDEKIKAADNEGLSESKRSELTKQRSFIASEIKKFIKEQDDLNMERLTYSSDSKKKFIEYCNDSYTEAYNVSVQKVIAEKYLDKFKEQLKICNTKADEKLEALNKHLSEFQDTYNKADKQKEIDDYKNSGAYKCRNYNYRYKYVKENNKFELQAKLKTSTDDWEPIDNKIEIKGAKIKESKVERNFFENDLKEINLINEYLHEFDEQLKALNTQLDEKLEALNKHLSEFQDTYNKANKQKEIDDYKNSDAYKCRNYNYRYKYVKENNKFELQAKLKTSTDDWEPIDNKNEIKGAKIEKENNNDNKVEEKVEEDFFKNNLKDKAALFDKGMMYILDSKKSEIKLFDDMKTDAFATKFGNIEAFNAPLLLMALDLISEKVESLKELKKIKEDNLQIPLPGDVKLSLMLNYLDTKFECDDDDATKAKKKKSYLAKADNRLKQGGSLNAQIKALKERETCNNILSEGDFNTLYQWADLYDKLEKNACFNEKDAQQDTSIDKDAQQDTFIDELEKLQINNADAENLRQRLSDALDQDKQVLTHYKDDSKILNQAKDGLKKDILQQAVHASQGGVSAPFWKLSNSMTSYKAVNKALKVLGEVCPYLSILMAILVVLNIPRLVRYANSLTAYKNEGAGKKANELVLDTHGKVSAQLYEGEANNNEFTLRFISMEDTQKQNSDAHQSPYSAADFNDAITESQMLKSVSMVAPKLKEKRDKSPTLTLKVDDFRVDQKGLGEGSTSKFERYIEALHKEGVSYAQMNLDASVTYGTKQNDQQKAEARKMRLSLITRQLEEMKSLDSKLSKLRAEKGREPNDAEKLNTLLHNLSSLYSELDKNKDIPDQALKALERTYNEEREEYIKLYAANYEVIKNAMSEGLLFSPQPPEDFGVSFGG